MTNQMKNKLNNLEDIRREKHKLLLEIGIHEYALKINFMQIKGKLTLASFSAYVIDQLRERIKAKIPIFLTALVGSFWRAFKRKKR